jgi:hypothetical protein
VVKKAKAEGPPLARDRVQYSDSENVQGDVWIPDDEMLNRITAVVKTPGGRTDSHHPIGLNRDKLVRDLIDARSKWLFFVPLDSDKGASTRAELFRGVAGAAKKFKQRLLDETGQKYAARVIASKAFSSRDRFSVFLRALDRVIEVAEASVRENSKGAWVRLSRSPKKWFAAEILPPIFERNFNRPAGTSQSSDSNAPGGPFIRFAVTVMREMGIPISEETVAAALKDVRAGRHPRQKRATSLPRPHGW